MYIIVYIYIHTYTYIYIIHIHIHIHIDIHIDIHYIYIYIHIYIHIRFIPIHTYARYPHCASTGFCSALVPRRTISLPFAARQVAEEILANMLDVISGISQ